MIAVHTVIPTVFTHYIQLQSILFTCRVSDIVYLHKWCISYISCIQYHMISLEKLPFIPWISIESLKKNHEDPMFSLMFIPWYPQSHPHPLVFQTASDILGRAMVIHDFEGGRIACGIIKEAVGTRETLGKDCENWCSPWKNDDFNVEFWDSVGISWNTSDNLAVLEINSLNR